MIMGAHIKSVKWDFPWMFNHFPRLFLDFSPPPAGPSRCLSAAASVKGRPLAKLAAALAAERAAWSAERLEESKTKGKT